MLSFGIILRLVLSTSVVVGGLLAVRWWSARAGGKARGAIRVVARAGLARSASVAVIDVGGRRYLVGAGEHSVTLIAELDRHEDLGSPLGGAATGDGPVADSGPFADNDNFSLHDSGTEQILHRDITGDDGLSLGLTRGGPRIGLVAHLRRMTTRVPREVRIHGYDG